MTEKHGFLDALKHVAFEDEPAQPAKHAPTLAPNATATTFASQAAVESAQPLAYAPPIAAIDAGVVPDNDAVYQDRKSVV